eukprot:31436-Pelagococcus_subviridis.AAC.10
MAKRDAKTASATSWAAKAVREKREAAARAAAAEEGKSDRDGGGGRGTFAAGPTRRASALGARGGVGEGTRRSRKQLRGGGSGKSVMGGGGGGGVRSRFTPVPVRPRRRCESRSLRTFAVASLRPRHGFNPDTPRRLSTPLLTPFNSTPISSLVWKAHPGEVDRRDASDAGDGGGGDDGGGRRSGGALSRRSDSGRSIGGAARKYVA